MRLIDADALKSALEMKVYNDYDDLLRTERLIDNAPTIEAPVPPGYKLVKRPDYDCSCLLGYPNKNYCRKNGHWKCVDDYEYVGQSRQGLTHCRRKKK